MKNTQSAMPYGPILNLYPDSLGGRLGDAADFLEMPEVKGVFSSLYILPSLFHSDLDRGFSIIDYGLNEALATRQDLTRIQNAGIKLILDFVINHAPSNPRSSAISWIRETPQYTGISLSTGTVSGPATGR